MGRIPKRPEHAGGVCRCGVPLTFDVVHDQQRSTRANGGLQHVCRIACIEAKAAGYRDALLDALRRARRCGYARRYMQGRKEHHPRPHAGGGFFNLID